MKTKTFISIATISLLILFYLPSPLVAFRCNQQDYKVLLEIKAALGNPYQLASWVEGTECCYWYCLDCDRKTNRVNALTISNANISGQIPAAVGDLPYLENLEFRKLTNLTGEIPQAIAKLTNLKQLWLSYTNLTGPVPSFLSKLTNLTFIDLSFNDLTGSIPSSLSKLPNLYSINLSRNKISGKIPDSFGEFGPTLQYITLKKNYLSGSIPKSLGNLKVQELDFSRNNFSGDLSFIFGPNKTITTADFSRNNFKFNLTPVVFPVMQHLDLSHNQIYGSLPESLTKIVSYGTLNVSYNQLCGSIPTGGILQSLDETAYFHNKCLCGPPLPTCKKSL